ncbi:kinase-like domain-containing protein [Diaporthe sp. PMI_573]|nr:kinase-like domain-containing protein [Diaporthaceae sp. PMI_573]
MSAYDGILDPSKLVQIGFGGRGYVYQCGGKFAFKQHGSDAEFKFMGDAGEVSITPYSRVLRLISGSMCVDGIIMELGSPLDIKNITSSAERRKVKDEMVSLVTRLHAKGIAHGDIRPTNLLRAQDRTLRLCDFDTAFYLDGRTQEWEGCCSPQYVSPNWGYPDYKLPSVEDDMYALAVSVWELYTGQTAMKKEYEELEDLIPRGYAVDVNAVEDLEVRSWIKEILVAGGARTFGTLA